LLESLLAPDGHTVRTAGDGAEALRLVRSEHPDLVLMDVMMPSVDVFDALTTKRPYTAALPFARAAEELRGGRSFEQEAVWTGDSRS
jgi:CheY-like chemotaxis protein